MRSQPLEENQSQELGKFASLTKGERLAFAGGKGNGGRTGGQVGKGGEAEDYQ